MNDFPDDLESEGDSPEPSFTKIAACLVAGTVLMLVGVAAVVGGFILHFAVKAEQVDLFPYAGRLVILMGAGTLMVGIVLAGWRAAVGFGVLTLVVGIGMLVFGFVKMSVPSLRFYAPLGFFVSLAGVCLIKGGLVFAHRMPRNVMDRLK